jgi:hypothetical protein
MRAQNRTFPIRIAQCAPEKFCPQHLTCAHMDLALVDPRAPVFDGTAARVVWNSFCWLYVDKRLQLPEAA